MKRTFYSVLAAAILAVMVVACGGNGGSIGGLSNTKWEYMVFNGRGGSYEREELNKTLNELGAQGWELVSTGLTYASNTGDLYLILKRKL